MPILDTIDFSITVDQVLKAQGADPEIIRNRNQNLVRAAEEALEIGRPLLSPKVLYLPLDVEAVRHEKIDLAENHFLKGRLITEHFFSAQTLIIIVCTVGEEVEKESECIVGENPVLALALEGVGSAAVEILANAVCKYLDDQAKAEGLETTIPISPGMVGWPLEEGQPQIFKILVPEQIGVELAPSLLMFPRKTLSMILGVGKNLDGEGSTCDYCAMRGTCQFRD